jgi:AraC-like DNA-binding protein
MAVHGLLIGFRTVGLDADDLARRCRVEGDLTVPGRLLPERTWADLWEAARARRPAAELALEVGLRLPFGAFGMVDYLVGSAHNLGAALDSLSRTFRLVARGFFLENGGTETHPRVTVVDTGGGSLDDDDFTLGTLVGRFRTMTRPPALTLRAVALRRRVSDPERFTSALNAPVQFGASTSWIEFGAPGRSAELTTSDPSLHEVMAGLVVHLGLGEGTSDFEAAVRSRLRLTLRDGGASAQTVARALGVSVRTLHRRLAESGRTWQHVVDDFRAHEAERLLTLERDISTVAFELGFQNTSAFARAFRRWKGTSPSEWTRTQSPR